MKTKTYTVIYGEDAPCYAMMEIEAGHDGEAIAKALAHNWDKACTDPDWDCATNRRIVNIEEGCRLVASDIPLDLVENEDGALQAKRDAAQELYDALVLARRELDRIFSATPSETLRLVNAALTKAEGGRS